MTATVDPWEWDTDRVVQELCTGKRTWKPSTDPPKLPNIEHLRESLRENEVDGQSLLGSASDAPDFWFDLGIKAIKHKETLRDAITQFRRASRKYKIWKLRQKEDDDDDYNIYNGVLGRLDETSRKRKLEEERKDESAESAYNTPQAILSGPSTPAAPLQAATPTVSSPAAPPTSAAKASQELATADGPIRKKRRIAPVTLSSDVSAEGLRNMPQGNLVSDLTPEEEEAAATKLSGAYIGPYVLNRADIIEFHFSAQPLANEDLEFEIQQESYPIGLRRQRARLVKRRLAKQQHVFRPSKADMVLGGDDPEHDQVLPAWGESDDEYDSETWKEIVEEADEREKLKEKPRTDLSNEEKNTIVDQIISEKTAAWETVKLPALQHRANHMWNKARKQGLKQAIDRESRLIARYRQRLSNFREEIVKQPWTNEADVRKVEGIFDQTIVDLEYSTWLLNLLLSLHEPKKLPRAPRRQRPKLAKEQIVGSDEEILASDSDSDEPEFSSFIIDDASQIRDEVMYEVEDDGQTNLEEPAIVNELIEVGTSNSTSTKTSEGVEHKTGAADVLPLEQDEEDVPTDLAEGTDPRSSEVAPAAEHAEGPQDRHTAVASHAPALPAAFARTIQTERADADNSSMLDVVDEEDVLDLTEPKIKVEETSTPMPKIKRASRTYKGVELVDLVTPEKGKAIVKSFQTPSRPQFVKSKSLGLSQLQENGLAENQNIVHELLKSLDEVHRSTIFSFALWEVDELWNGFVVPSLHSPYLPKTPLRSENEQDLFYGLHLARLFDAYLGDKSQHLRRWFQSQAGRIALEDKKDFFPEFVSSLRELSLNYSIGMTPKKPMATPLSSPKKSTKVLEEPEKDLEGDLDDLDTDESSSNGKKRKTVIKRDQAALNLRESDQRRVQEQAERIKALRTKLALSNDITASQNMGFIINESKQDDQGFIYVPENIARRIKDHQISGVRFMWNQIVVDIKSRQGCLLAHTMGLGKTMQIITLLLTISGAAASTDPSVSSQIPDDLKESKTLILAPASLVNNWYDEFIIWTHGSKHHLGEVYKIDANYKEPDRLETLESWSTKGGVLLIGYTLFRQLLMQESEKIDALLLEAPNLIVADEAHLLKNKVSLISEYAAGFRSHVRIALTGSPLANNVLEYYSMINWIATNYLGGTTEFRQDFAQPIEAGLSADSLHSQRRKALVKLRSLKETVAPKVHRRTIHALKDELPQKTEFVISVPLTDMQRKAYELYMNYVYVNGETARLFAILQILALLCNHPACFRSRLIKATDNKTDDGKTRNAALPPQLVSEELTLIRHADVAGAAGEVHSWKIPLFNKIINESIRQGDKVLVFSQSLPTLDYLESVLNRQKQNFIRLDGSTTMNKRQDMVKDFNNDRNTFDVFLISTTAGGLGLNITGANRVIIFDSKFNPQHEQQAVGRAYRLGQTKPVFVYRLICGGTFEEKMQNKGVFKLQLASRVVDKKNPIPKAQSFQKMFDKPVEPEQQDLSAVAGKDNVLDVVLNSELVQGIRSIVLSDTFEEENLEDEQLTIEEIQEAKQLIELHQARLTGMPIAAGHHPLPPIASSFFSVPPPGGLNDIYAQDAVAQFHAGASGDGPRAPHPVNGSMGTAPTAPKSLEGAPHPSFQTGTVQPVLGPTTQVREAVIQMGSTLSASELNFWGNANVLKGELGRLFTAGETDAETKDKKRQAAQSIANAFRDSDGQRNHHESAQAKIALIESARSSHLIEAILEGKYTPEQLASLSGDAIRQLSLELAPVSSDDQGSETAKAADDKVHSADQITKAGASATGPQGVNNHRRTQTHNPSGRAMSAIHPEVGVLGDEHTCRLLPPI
ncbi:hypothetical protein TruAng_002482 [Truncatella angustata]|nr:hypothetical protein TruAng_002482 [Truncatella angustata]